MLGILVGELEILRNGTYGDKYNLILKEKLYFLYFSCELKYFLKNRLTRAKISCIIILHSEILCVQQLFGGVCPITRIVVKKF